MPKLHRTAATALLLSCFLWPCSALADIRLPRLVDSGMVLQRDEPTKLWGWADPGEKVSLQFQQATYTATANDQGRWAIELPAQPAGGPHRMTLTGKNTLELQDVLFGDVWLASGQSNMELTLARAEPRFPELVPRINNRNIRQFEVPDHFNFKAPQDDLPAGQWLPATPEHIRKFSAVAYFFAEQIHSRQKVPVGIINASLGGSPVEAWISEDTLKRYTETYQEALRFRDDALIERITQADQARSDAWFSELNRRDKGLVDGEYRWAAAELETDGWATTQIPGYWSESAEGTDNGVVWFRKTVTVPKSMAGREALLILGAIVDADQVFVNGTQVGATTYQYPPRRYPVPASLLKPGENVIALRVTSQSGRGGFVPGKAYELRLDDEAIDLSGTWHYMRGATIEPLASQTFIRWKPMGLYNAMIAPLLPYRIKGVIWYQGESNAGDAQSYRERFPAMIADWRKHWNQGELPFLFVQLANFQPPGERADQSGGWARLREAQRQTALSVPNTAMVVAIDAGEWNDIHPLDKQTIGKRLAAAAEHLAYGEDKVYAGPMFRSAKAKGQKMVLRFDQLGGGLVAKGGPLQEFAIAGADGLFHPAKAKIKGDTVVVWSDAVNAPKAVRYGWSSNPAKANLFNREGFPASPFHSGDVWSAGQ